MKKILSIVFLAVFLALVVSPAAFAMHSEPIAGCPGGFELHMLMGDEDHDHHHIGISTDKNGDHWVCVRHDLHLHIDNTVPFR